MGKSIVILPRPKNHLNHKIESVCCIMKGTQYNAG